MLLCLNSLDIFYGVLSCFCLIVFGLISWHFIWNIYRSVEVFCETLFYSNSTLLTFVVQMKVINANAKKRGLLDVNDLLVVQCSMFTSQPESQKQMVSRAVPLPQPLMPSECVMNHRVTGRLSAGLMEGRGSWRQKRKNVSAFVFLTHICVSSPSVPAVSQLSVCLMRLSVLCLLPNQEEDRHFRNVWTRYSLLQHVTLNNISD